jgi:murein tripeptide amidase MpaA
MKRAFLLLFALFYLIAATQKVRFDNHTVVRVTFDTKEQIQEVQTLFENDPVDVWSNDGEMGLGPNDIMLSPSQKKTLVNFLTKKGISYLSSMEILHRNVQDVIDADEKENREAEQKVNALLSLISCPQQRKRVKFADNVWFQQYHNYTGIREFMDELHKKYPQQTTAFSVGKSLEGREMAGLIVHAPGKYEPTKNSVWFNHIIHAREWISPPIGAWALKHLLEQYQTDDKIKQIINAVNVHIMLFTNPDGYEYTRVNRMWRKNRRGDSGGIFGVDLNRNWPVGFGGAGSSGNKNSETYRGPSALSEPESQNIAKYITAHPSFKAGIDWHSYSQLVLRPYGYTTQLAPDEAKLKALGQEMADAIKSAHGATYRNIRATELYPASGITADWFYKERKMAGYVIELRDTGQFGFLLPPRLIIPTCEENYKAIIKMLEFAAKQ